MGDAYNDMAKAARAHNSVHEQVIAQDLWYKENRTKLHMLRSTRISEMTSADLTLLQEAIRRGYLGDTYIQFFPLVP